MGKRKAEEPSPEEPKAKETVAVIYRGPHGRFIAGPYDMTLHGSPVEMPRELLEELRATWPEHRFEEAE